MQGQRGTMCHGLDAGNIDGRKGIDVANDPRKFWSQRADFAVGESEPCKARKFANLGFVHASHCRVLARKDHALVHRIQTP